MQDNRSQSRQGQSLELGMSLEIKTTRVPIKTNHAQHRMIDPGKQGQEFDELSPYGGYIRLKCPSCP